MYMGCMPPQDLQGLDGLGSKLKSALKRVEQVSRPLVKVAAVGAAAAFAPAVLPVVAAAVIPKPKASAPSDSVPVSPPQFAQQFAPQPVLQAASMPVPMAAPAGTYASGAAPAFAPAGAMDTQKLLTYGAIGLGAVFVLSMLTRR